MKKALITGITGQDGSYLADFLLEKGYKVCGLVRRSSTFNTHRIDHVIESEDYENFIWERADLADSDSLLRVLKSFRPDEVYHLGAQSHVSVSFEIPNYTFDVVAAGTLRLLEAIRTLELPCKIYNACSSEMFGSSPPPQNEGTPFHPRSPYAVGKVAAYHMAVLYREAYDMEIYNGILFNHESPRRGETFVTRKITRAVSRIANGVQDRVCLGNLDSRRDWGYAREYVEAMWTMLQSGKPGDYVAATGESHSVREFVEVSFAYVGVKLKWEGDDVDERGIISDIKTTQWSSQNQLKKGDVVVSIDKKYFRPAEVDYLSGDSKKSFDAFGWKPIVKFNDLVTLMMEADLKRAQLLLDGTRNSSEEWREYIV